MGTPRFAPISQREEMVARHIVNSAFTVHNHLGPGLLEKVYEACFCHELKKRGLSYNRQLDIPIVYDGLTFDEALRLDVLVEDIVDLRAQEGCRSGESCLGSAGAESSQVDWQAPRIPYQFQCPAHREWDSTVRPMNLCAS